MQHLNLPVGFSGGLVTWRLRALHLVAKALGLLVKVEGFPYGSSRNLGYRDWDARVESFPRDLGQKRAA